MLEAGATLLAHTFPGPDLPAPSTDLLMHLTTGCPVTPGSPAKLLLSNVARAGTTSQRHTLGPLTAVILGMVVGSKLETVVGATDEVSLAASVSIIVATVPRTVTVTLSLIAGVLRGAAPLTIVIPASTSLTCRRLQGNTSRDQGQRLRDSQGLWKVTAVILFMEVCAKLLAVVAATHQVSLTATVTIISSSIKRPITVTLTISTWALWSAAPTTIEVTPSTSLALRGLCQWSAGGTLTKSKGCENCQ